MLNGEVVEVIKNVRYLKKQTQISILCFIRYLIKIEENLAVKALTVMLVISRSWLVKVFDEFQVLVPLNFDARR